MAKSKPKPRVKESPVKAKKPMPKPPGRNNFPLSDIAAAMPPRKGK